MRPSLALGVAASVLLVSIPAPVASSDAPPSRDLAGAEVREQAIKILAEQGIFSGTECGPQDVCPDLPLPRWVMAVWMVRAMGNRELAATPTSSFTDVPVDAWWSPYVERLRELGIVHGCEGNPVRYCPHQTVTRLQMAGLLTRAFNLLPAFEIGSGGSFGFTDIAGRFRLSEIEALAYSGITTGCSVDPLRYCPNRSVTRGEMAIFLSRALKLVPRVEHIADVNNQGLLHLVSQYTTFYPCCRPRVTNIRRFAEIVDGAVVAPGQVFSLNAHVGRRTVAKGFVGADTLIGGRLVSTVGGGVSQFATTLYNAAFWGGYEVVNHKPHSRYFSRYPEGIEATINWPDVDLVLRNDTSSNLIIKTVHSDTSVTVQFFGYNHGRAVAGEWEKGRGHMQVLADGGPRARVVAAGLSRRSRWTYPPRPVYRSNPTLGIGEKRYLQPSLYGWTLQVTRTISQGNQDTTQEWRVKYLPMRAVIEVNPCVLSVSCSDPGSPPTGQPAG